LLSILLPIDFAADIAGWTVVCPEFEMRSEDAVTLFSISQISIHANPTGLVLLAEIIPGGSKKL
jgi:hypothetical protein